MNKRKAHKTLIKFQNRMGKAEGRNYWLHWKKENVNGTSA